MCTIGIGVDETCTGLFHKDLNKGHFLMGNGLYVYKEDEFSQEEFYLYIRMGTFIKELGYYADVTPQDETSHKCLERLIKTHLLMNTCTSIW